MTGHRLIKIVVVNLGRLLLNMPGHTLIPQSSILKMIWFCLYLFFFYNSWQYDTLKLQVIFPALDIRVKNVAQTYSLEHKGDTDLFDHLFELLNSSTQNDENFPRELASCTGVLQTSVSQHMAKEEEQVLRHLLLFVL